MDISRDIHQMVTTPRRPAAPGMPARGTTLVIDGVECMVTSSARVPGALVVYGLDNDNVEHRIRIPQ